MNNVQRLEMSLAKLVERLTADMQENHNDPLVLPSHDPGTPSVPALEPAHGITESLDQD